MKFTFKVAAIASLAMIGSQTMADNWSDIRIATEGAYAPWNFTNSAGQLEGFEVDLIEELCTRMEANCEVVTQAWDGIIPALEAGKYDAIMAGMSITDERRKVISFSRSYAATPAIFVVPIDSDMANGGLEEARIDLAETTSEEQSQIDAVAELLDGLSVGVQTATIHENFLRDGLNADIDIRTYDSQENLDLDLQSGRLDAALADQAGWQPLLDGEAGEEFTRAGPGFSGGVFGEGVGVGIRQSDTALVEKFNTAIQSALEDGTVGELAVKWFGFDSSAAP